MGTLRFLQPGVGARGSVTNIKKTAFNHLFLKFQASRIIAYVYTKEQFLLQITKDILSYGSDQLSFYFPKYIWGFMEVKHF